VNRARRRQAVLAGLIVAIAIAIGLNVLGILRYPGGPLRESSADGFLWLDVRPADQGSNAVGDVAGSWHAVDVPLQFGILTVSNPSSFSATIDAITPIDATPGLVIDAVYVMRPDMPRGEVLAWGPSGVYPPASILTSDYTALPATVVPTGATHEHDPAVLVIVRSAEAGPIGWSALEVAYRIGPFAFRAIHHLELRGCLGPLPSGAECGDEPVDHEDEDGEGS